MKKVLFLIFLLFYVSGCSHITFVPLKFEPKENTADHEEVVAEINQQLLPMLSDFFIKEGWNKHTHRSQRMLGQWEKINTTAVLFLYSPIHPTYYLIYFDGDRKLIERTLMTLQKKMNTWGKRYQKTRLLYSLPSDFKGFRAASSL